MFVFPSVIGRALRLKSIEAISAVSGIVVSSFFLEALFSSESGLFIFLAVVATVLSEDSLCERRLDNFFSLLEDNSDNWNNSLPIQIISFPL